MSTPAPDSASDVPFKVYLQHHIKEPPKDATVIHRFCGSFNFCEIQALIGELYGAPPTALLINYDDSENDRIRVTSEMQWREALRLYLVESNSEGGSAKHPLRLYVHRIRKEPEKGREKPSKILKNSAELDESDVPTEARERPASSK